MDRNVFHLRDARAAGKQVAHVLLHEGEDHSYDCGGKRPRPPLIPGRGQPPQVPDYLLS